MPNTAAIDFYRMRSLGIEMWKLEIHRRLIRTGLGACFANFIDEAAMAAGTGGTSIGTKIEKCRFRSGFLFRGWVGIVELVRQSRFLSEDSLRINLFVE